MVATSTQRHYAPACKRQAVSELCQGARTLSQRIRAYMMGHNDLFIVIGLCVITLGYTGVYFSQYIRADIIPGWDGTQHYAVNKAYSDSIYPSLEGILPNWYAGLPWPTFYPPLFTYTMAVLGHILPISYFVLFKYLFVVLTFAFPLLVFWIARKLAYSPFESLLAGFFAILYLVSSGDQGGTLGISMGGTFENGLYPQFFASCIFLLWLGTFLQWVHRHEEKRGTLLSLVSTSVLFGFVLISNVHIAQPAILTFCIFFLLYGSSIKGIWKHFVFQTIVAFCIAGVWYIPLFTYNQYFLTQTISEVPLQIALLSLFVPLILGGCGGWFGFQSKRVPVQALCLSALVIIGIIVIPWARVWSGLPLQPFRVFPVAYLFLMILAPLGIQQVLNWLALSGRLRVLGFLIILAPIIYWYPPVDRSISGVYTLSNEEKELVTFLHSKTDGRSMFEVWLDDAPTPYLPKAKQPTHFILSALAGVDSKHQTLWGAFRESSILSPFVQPLRNAFSYQHESYGVVCYLCVNTNGIPGFRADEFYQQDMLTQFKRAKLLGVKYIVLRTDIKKSQLDKEKKNGVIHIKDFGKWTVYSIEESSLSPIKLTHEPMLTFARLDPRSRKAEGDGAYDWLRLNEEWFFQAHTDQVLARSEASYLDEMTELSAFKVLFIPEYSYWDTQKTISMLTSFAKYNHIILFRSDDPVYLSLTRTLSIPKDHIHSIEKTGDVREDMAHVMATLETFNQAQSAKGTWILHKETFFPSLKDTYPHSIYLASPAFMLEKR